MSANIKHSEFRTYLSMIEGSVDANIWRHGYSVIDGVETDIMKNGEVSCAFFVSSLLKIFDLVDKYHATVKSTVEDMERNGWDRVEDEPQAGDVILWGPRPGTADRNDHLGFYIGDSRVVSNNYVSSKPEAGGKPEVHDWKYEGHPDGVRPLVAIYRGRHLFGS